MLEWVEVKLCTSFTAKSCRELEVAPTLMLPETRPLIWATTFWSMASFSMTCLQ